MCPCIYPCLYACGKILFDKKDITFGSKTHHDLHCKLKGKYLDPTYASMVVTPLVKAHLPVAWILWDNHGEKDIHGKDPIGDALKHCKCGKPHRVEFK